jgi:hypothetical protein
MPTRLTSAVVLAMAACYAGKLFLSVRSSRRSKEMLRRGREIAATTRKAYA